MSAHLTQKNNSLINSCELSYPTMCSNRAAVKGLSILCGGDA